MDPFIGEVKIVGFNFAPKGWAFCNGQTLPINQNQALFSLLGTTYGGNGSTTFQLPDLRGRAAMHTGQQHQMGERAGEETHTLTGPEMAGHTHTLMSSALISQTDDPANAYLADTPAFPYKNAAPNTSLAPKSVNPVGGSGPHPNMQPYLTLSFVIALQGVFPSRN